MRHRVLPIAMIAVEAAALIYVSGSWPLPVAVVVACLVSALTGVRVALKPAHRYRVVLGFAALFAIQGRFYPLALPVSLFSTPLDYPQLHALAQFFLCAQAAMLIARPSPLDPGEGGTAVWSLCGIGAIAAATTYSAHTGSWAVVTTLYISFAILFALLQGGYGSLQRRGLLHPRTAVALLLLAGVAVLGAGTSHGLRENISLLDQTFAKLTNGNNGRGAGLSGQGGLHSVSNVKGRDALAPIVQIESSTMPGYLRAYAFDHFDGLNWRNMKEVKRNPIDAARPRSLPPLATAQHWFPLAEALSAHEEGARFWLEDPNSRTFLIPDEAAWLGAAAATVWRDDNGVVGLDRAIAAAYRVLPAPDLEDAASTPEPAVYTQLPPKVDPRVVARARQIVAEAANDTDKIHAVLGYFRDHYAYSLDYSPPPDWDGLTHFLIEQPAAHCEYFATGAALLLRLGGVPCRYVTGAVATEQNPVSGMWVARRRDAHAWVEVWRPDTGWSRIDPTPGGPGEGDAVPARQYIAEAVRQQWRTVWDGLRNDAVAYVSGALTALGSFLTQTGPGRMLLLLGAAALAWSTRRGWKGWTPRRKVAHTPLSRLLHEVDQHARRLGYIRAPSETLHAFAARIDAPALAAWYRAYAGLRYDPKAKTAQAATRLAREAAQLTTH